MSVNSKARKGTTQEDILYELKKENQLLHALLRDKNGFSAAESKPIGTAAGQTNAAAGFLRTEGDTMIGPIAFFPDLTIIDSTDDSIDVSKASAEAYSSRIFVSTSGGSSDLETIHGASFGGQLLMIQGILTETITIKHGLGNIRTVDGGDLEIVDNQNVWLVFDLAANEWAVISGGGGGTGTGLFVSADLVADQTANLAVGNHIEFDRNAAPTGADGGIVLQTGAGQADGIFELKAGKTYFLSGVVSPIKSAATQLLVAWYDITGAQELGRRTVYDVTNVLFLDNQPKAEIIFTPTVDSNVELRIVANSTPANLTGFFAITTHAHIFEFSGKNGSDGAAGAPGTIGFKDPVRAKTTVDVPTLAAFTVLTDGVTLVENDRVLLTEQTTASENGIYDVGVVAAGIAPLTRSLDLDANAELVASLIVMVEEGTLHKNTMWQLTSNNPLTIGVSNQLWEEFESGAGVTIPGATGKDGTDASGTFIGDGRQFAAFDLLSRLQGFRNVRGPQGESGSLMLIPNDGYDHGDFGGTPPPPAELNPQEVLVVVGNASESAFGGDTNSSYSLNYGETWVANNQLSNDGWGSLAYDPTGRILLCAAGFSGASRNIGRSTDKGQSWGSTLHSFGSLGLGGLIWSEANSLFIVLTKSITGNAIYTSPDGLTWTNRTTPVLTFIPPSIAARSDYLVEAPALGKIFAFGSNATDFISSTDGITWVAENYIDVLGNTDAGFLFSDSLGQVVWSEGQRKFLAPTLGVQMKTTGMLQSIDFGKTWTRTSAVPQYQASTFGPKDLIWVPRYSCWIMGGGYTNPLGGTSPWAFSLDGDVWIPAPHKEFRAHEADYDESFLAQPGGGEFLAFSESFGYIFGWGGGRNSTSDDYRNNSFTRTQVYFNDSNSQSGLNFPNIRERDFLNPR